jgi:hypothetical protein
MNSTTDSPIGRLAQWMRERATCRRLDELFPTGGDSSTPSGAHPRCPYDADPRPGDIRLLEHRPGMSSERTPVFILVLDQNADGSFEVAPFSRFSQPATSGEFLILPPDDVISAHREFRTVCLWNSFRLPAEDLARSWTFGQLPDNDVEDVRAVAQWLQSATLHSPLDPTRLPDDLRRRIGPPVSKLGGMAGGMALFEVMEYLGEEEAWTWELANPGLAAAPVAALAALVQKEAESPASLSIPWQDLLQNVARLPAGFGPPEDLARRFAVWVSDSPASQILQSAGQATLLFYEEATRVWEKVLPKSASGQLLWETEKTVEWPAGPSAPGPVYGFAGALGGAPPRRSSPTLVHTPDLPSGCPVLLLDGRTSQLLGQGETSKGGIQIHLLTEIPPDAPLQLVLCKKEPPPEDFI